MKFKKTAAAMLVAAVIIISFSACGQSRDGYMLNNCTKDGVKEFLAQNEELAGLGFTEKTCYNVTPDDFNGIKMFKSSQTAYTVVLYPGYSYTYIDISDAPGLISAKLCDLEGSGLTDDILFTYSDKTKNEYGIGIYNGILGYSSSVFRGEGDLCLYLEKQEAAEGMPDVYSVFSAAVTQFKNNPADLGCVITGSVGVITIADGRPVFSIDSGVDVKVREMSYDNIKRFIVSTVDKSKSYTEKADIDAIRDLLTSVQVEDAPTESPDLGVTYIIAAVYEDDSVAYAYISSNGYYKHHGGEWRKIKGEFELPF